ncbi:MAG: CHAT domain-containing protein [Desulfobacteraceae bacterium]|nr:MAG: CHAT domain-containing protein [Desulfobacteraceae bacterium]
MTKPITNPDLFHLEIVREADHLKISLALQRRGEIQTVRQVEELFVPLDSIGRRSARLGETLNQANRHGRLTPELLARLKETGQLFRDELFSAKVKEQLNTRGIDHLILSLDDQLVHIPWELLHDGTRFMGQRFAMGRVIRTRHTILSPFARDIPTPMQMLVLADPAGELTAAYQEGLAIRDFAEGFKDKLNVFFRSGNVSEDFIKAKLRYFDLVHFAGHADYDPRRSSKSAWRLGQGRLSAEGIVKMAGTGRMPALIFANACQSARADHRRADRGGQTRIFNLANAFLLSGVKHYLGTIWEIPDDASKCFAMAFYRHLLGGLSVGMAVRTARQAVADILGEQNTIWASYLLYGDPTTAYFHAPATERAAENVGHEPAPALPEAVTVGTRAPEDVIRFSPAGGRKRRLCVAIAAVMVLCAALGTFLAAAWIGSGKRAADYEQQALASFQTGDYANAEQTCRYMQQSWPERAFSHLLLGNVHFLKGKFAEAGTFYRNAVAAPQGTVQDKTEALLGLGRIASEDGLADQALGYYRQAAAMSPRNESACIAEALLLNRRGDHHRALALLKEAAAVSSDPAALEALISQVQSRAELADDRQRLERIDRMIDDLLARMDSGPRTLPANTWSSRSLSIWLLPFTAVGYDLHEGRAELMTSGILYHLLQEQRLQMVEREMLDRLLSELKLGASRLSEPNTYLSLGRLVAARLIILGRLVHEPPQTQVTLRCIETETGQVVAVISDVVDGGNAVSQTAAGLAAALKARLAAYYPVRACIVEEKKDFLVLDIGQRQGAAVGMSLRGVNADLVVKVVAVEADRCTAKIQGVNTSAGVGLQLEAIP